MRMKSPIVTITTAITDFCCTGRMNTSCTTVPNTKATTSVIANAAQ